MPLPLQYVYENFWTDNLSILCYIAFLEDQPGILLSAEYDDEYCELQGIPTESDAQYVELYDYGKRLEALAHSIYSETVVGINEEGSVGPELIMFIPASVPIGAIPRLYYLMDKFGYTKAPDTIQLSKEDMTQFIKSLGRNTEIEQEMLETLTSDTEEFKSAGSLIQYMGLQINSCDLCSKYELTKDLSQWGAFDSNLDTIRKQYMERFGCQLIWNYPFSGSMRGGGTIVPVQEGFLFLPYTCMVEHSGARYNLSQSVFLNTQAVQAMQKECKTYVEGLLSALGDISVYEQSYSIQQYMDTAGDIYYIRNDRNYGYTGFRRYAVPRKNGKREQAIRSLQYTQNIRKAQLDLDQYALEHRLRPLTEEEQQKEGLSHN